MTQTTSAGISGLAGVADHDRANALAPSAVGRLHFLDHLRAVVILLVIVLHTSITYMVSPPPWWYVIAPENSLIFTALVLLVNVPIMQILFFIAGFFAYESLEKRGPSGFLRQKAVRLGLPWLFGVVFLAPLVTYLITVTRGVARPYLEFWATDFWGPYYQQSVYWFLGILLLLFVLLAAARDGDPRLQHIRRQSQTPAWTLFARFWALTTVWFFAASLLAPADTWSNVAKVFVFQPTRLLLYAGYFGLGVVADRRGWLRAGGYWPDSGWWGSAALLAGLLYLGLRLAWPGDAGILLLAVQAALFNAFCLAALLAAVALFHRFFNRPSRLWSSLSRNAYAIYYLHPLILYPAAYVALFVPMSIYLEPVLLILLTTLAAWGLGALVLTRWPVLRNIF